MKYIRFFFFYFSVLGMNHRLYGWMMLNVHAIGEVCITSCQRCPTAEQHNCLHTEDITVKCGMQRCIYRLLSHVNARKTCEMLSWNASSIY